MSRTFPFAIFASFRTKLPTVNVDFTELIQVSLVAPWLSAAAIMTLLAVSVPSVILYNLRTPLTGTNVVTVRSFVVNVPVEKIRLLDSIILLVEKVIVPLFKIRISALALDLISLGSTYFTFLVILIFVRVQVLVGWKPAMIIPSSAKMLFTKVTVLAVRVEVIPMKIIAERPVT